jgi:hypothetical protein
MPATKISALTAGGASQATDEYVVARAGDNRKITGADIAAAATSLGIVARLQAASGTITADAPVLNLTQTWNNAAVVFTGIKLNVTETASANGSFLLDLQRGGVSRFAVYNTGQINFHGGQYALIFKDTGSTTIRGGVDFWPTQDGFGFFGSNLVSVNFFNTTVARLASGIAFGWASGSPVTTAFDVTLFRDAASVLALRTGTTAQTFRLYNTFTDASNYERGKFEWASNVLRIGTEKLGTGSARAVELQTDGTTALTLTTGQKAEFAQTIKTGAPSGGTAAEWKLGTVATVSPTSPNRTIEVDIGGTIYYIHAKTTNN